MPGSGCNMSGSRFLTLGDVPPRGTFENIKGQSKRNEYTMSGESKIDRREFFGAAVAAIAAGEIISSTSAMAQIVKHEQKKNITFGPLKQIEAGLLNVGYAEDGPADGQVVILLHGWPYDIHSFVEVAPLLASKGYRVIVPHLRGHGTTRFLSEKTFRNGQQAAVAVDIIALMDSLNIKNAILAGYDWGARTACIIAALWPERCKALVSVYGYLVNNLERNRLPLSPKAEWGWWYQFYFSTERGKAGYEANRQDFAKLIWKNVSPKWNFDEATFNRTAASFDNPDYISIVIHNYRWRLSIADGEAKYDHLEKQLAAGPVIKVPAITLDGDSDGVAPATDGAGYAARFSGKYSHKIIRGAGHNLPQEAPQAFVDAIIEVDNY